MIPKTIDVLRNNVSIGVLKLVGFHSINALLVNVYTNISNNWESGGSTSKLITTNI